MNLLYDGIYVDVEFFNPILMIRMKFEYFSGYEALIGASGYLIYEDKIIGKLQLKADLQLTYNINAKDATSNEINGSHSLFFDCELSQKLLKYINDKRKDEKNGDVILKLKISLSYLETEAQIISSPNQQKVATPMGFQALYVGSGNTYLRTGVYPFRFEIRISASDWINDYAPKLGLGEYEIIEIPRLNTVSIKEKFSNSLSALEESRKHMYSLNNGSAMSSLRNSFREFNEALVNIGYKEENGKINVDYGKIFDNNKNIKNIVETLQKNLHGSSSRGKDSPAPHMGNPVEGYEIESMIFMTYSLYKMVFEKLREKEESEGD